MSVPHSISSSEHPLRVPTEHLRWSCDPASLGFETTLEVEPLHGVVGQDDAVEALRYGLEVHAPGQNVFVRGLTGTGRLSLVKRLLEDIQPSCPVAQDRCYVRNFTSPDRPRLVSLPRGRGRSFKQRIEVLADYIQAELVPALSSDRIQAARDAIQNTTREEIQAKSKGFEKELGEADLTMVSIRQGEQTSTAILPLIDGQAVQPEQFEALLAEGKVEQAYADKVRASLDGFAERFNALNEYLHKLQEEQRINLRDLYETEARRLLDIELGEIEATYPSVSVRTFLAEIIEDVVGSRLAALQEGSVKARELYSVNLLVSRESEGCPVIVENTPTLQNLLGTIDRSVQPGGIAISDHTMIAAGSLLRAEGGFLILDARDLLSENGAWKVLVRTLRTGRLEIVPHDMGAFGGASNLKPEPIEINVKIVLIGDPQLYYALDGKDSDFPNLFKVLADFETEIPRDEAGEKSYAGLLAGLAQREGLPPFSAAAAAVLLEHGARIAGRSDRLTMRFGRLSDIAREAAFLTTHRDAGAAQVSGEHVKAAIRRSRERADRPSRRFRSNIADGTIRIETDGSCVGQVNGLAVMSAGPLTFGFPARITASAGAGSRGIVNIERESQLSGRIHTKGSHILGGLLRQLLPTSHPLVFTISLAFEQSYGGVDGDSASGAETCCVLSALTGIPLRQDLAMTGAIDQFGHIQPIGGATEKVEGFFDACSDMGLTGTQGVILPRANRRNLMLREEVVAACAEGRFHIYCVEHISEALELFTGVPCGTLDEDGNYPEGSLLGRAMERAAGYWRRVSGRAIPPELDPEPDEAPKEATQGAPEEA
ncbi:MAG: putative ATP-dependent protease [Planctomycetota bacterium]|jgi:predicted ATP-dependent protease